jgi:hypothetical protein
MVTSLSKNLENYAEDVRFRAIVRAAQHMLELADIDEESVPKGEGQTAQSIADLNAFRKKSGYYANATILGLDESIESLRSFDGHVRLGSIDTRLGMIASWVDDNYSLVALMIFYKKNQV